ncbi:hypothetical protein WMY93_003508 [Mugilogobius chulae]|uniref:Uncharacterized protein n=1 Tax=Mugilogobius chulae TaxID=88201 RepID=A0AAW0Q7J3_9GOBI
MTLLNPPLIRSPLPPRTSGSYRAGASAGRGGFAARDWLTILERARGVGREREVEVKADGKAGTCLPLKSVLSPTPSDRSWRQECGQTWHTFGTGGRLFQVAASIRWITHNAPSHDAARFRQKGSGIVSELGRSSKKTLSPAHTPTHTAANNGALYEVPTGAMVTPPFWAKTGRLPCQRNASPPTLSPFLSRTRVHLEITSGRLGIKPRLWRCSGRFIKPVEEKNHCSSSSSEPQYFIPTSAEELLSLITISVEEPLFLITTSAEETTVLITTSVEEPLFLITISVEEPLFLIPTSTEEPLSLITTSAEELLSLITISVEEPLFLITTSAEETTVPHHHLSRRTTVPHHHLCRRTTVPYPHINRRTTVPHHHLCKEPLSLITTSAEEPMFLITTSAEEPLFLITTSAEEPLFLITTSAEEPQSSSPLQQKSHCRSSATKQNHSP